MPRIARTNVLAPLLLLSLLAGLAPPDARAAEDPGDFQITRTGSGLTLHKEMFLLPGTYSDKYRGRHTEVVFQISAKQRLFSRGLYLAYTQISFWQAYDFRGSAPFRDTNYNPEIFYRFRTRQVGSSGLGADAGFEHESNGQQVPLSRSWNLLYFSPWYQRGRLLLLAKLRYRIPEDPKPTPDSAEGDDNPDITDYLGYSDVHVYFRFAGLHQVHLAMRGVIGSGRGNASLAYSCPLRRGDDSYLFVRLFHGYGESLMNYRQSVSRVGVGIALAR
jgi:phospholipase A1/A2